jgi:hypothetical protein
MTAAGISAYTYHPAADRNLPSTLSVRVTQFGFDTLTNVMTEFWPDIRRRLRKSRAN